MDLISELFLVVVVDTNDTSWKWTKTGEWHKLPTSELKVKLVNSFQICIADKNSAGHIYCYNLNLNLNLNIMFQQPNIQQCNVCNTQTQN